MKKSCNINVSWMCCIFYRPVIMCSHILFLRYALRTNETQRGSSSIFYVAPSKFLGNKKSSYGRYLSILLKPSLGNSAQPVPSSNVSGNETNTSVVTVQLSAEFNNLTLVYIHSSSSNVTSTAEIFLNVWQVFNFSFLILTLLLLLLMILSWFVNSV